MIFFCNTTGKPASNITCARVLDDGTNSEVMFFGNPRIIINIRTNFIGTGILVNSTVSFRVLFFVKVVFYA